MEKYRIMKDDVVRSELNPPAVRQFEIWSGDEEPDDITCQAHVMAEVGAYPIRQTVETIDREGAAHQVDAEVVLRRIYLERQLGRLPVYRMLRELWRNPDVA